MTQSEWAHLEAGWMLSAWCSCELHVGIVHVGLGTQPPTVSLPASVSASRKGDLLNAFLREGCQRVGYMCAGWG